MHQKFKLAHQTQQITDLVLDYKWLIEFDFDHSVIYNPKRKKAKIHENYSSDESTFIAVYGNWKRKKNYFDNSALVSTLNLYRFMWNYSREFDS